MKLTGIFSIIMMALIVISCGESNSPSVDNLTLKSNISQTSLSNSTNVKQDEIQNGITNIKIHSVRILLNNITIKLNDNERNIKAVPVVFTVTDEVNSYEFANADLPQGGIDKIKFEIHRFASSEIDNYKSNPSLKDFATDERFTIIIKGTTINNADETPFEYKSEVVGNLSFDFNPPLLIEDNKNLIVDFEFQSEMVFKDKGFILDPNDSNNKSHIDNQIKNAIRAIKR
ncbi:MAG: hypothetical protein CVV22_12235 [Ignavibacteriae bacterium HGW-Ignavibacteriae-1]|jgi:hypothetical protein|nr:MAG: hypothetical protein CVV22_12235 [Ignavibacteriae bacterium HGW-Ignavibacteriae-1]